MPLGDALGMVRTRLNPASQEQVVLFVLRAVPDAKQNSADSAQPAPM